MAVVGFNYIPITFQSLVLGNTTEKDSLDRMLLENGTWIEDKDEIKEVVTEKLGNIVKKQPEHTGIYIYKGKRSRNTSH